MNEQDGQTRAALQRQLDAALAARAELNRKISTIRAVLRVRDEPASVVGQDIRKPANLDLSKGQAIVQQIIRENREWIKEMADK